jgi:4-amino-4-deoxy-L-arabinose transferase-like glycosyltransferase
VAVAVKTDGEWLRQFVTKYNVGPFVKPFLGHRGPWYYHFVVVLVGFFPWSVFLGPTVAHAWRAVRERGREMPCYVFVVCWIAVYFGFWSVCSTKLPHYVLAAYPALAILTACFLDAWSERAEVAAHYMMPTATAIFVAVGVLMLAVLPWVAARYAPGDEIIALLGLTLVIGGGAAMSLLLAKRRFAYLSAIAAASVIFIAAFFGWAALRIDRHQHSRPLLTAVFGDTAVVPQIAGYKYLDPSTVYYARGTVAEIDSGEKLAGFLAESKNPYVLTTGDGLKELEAQMPGSWRVVARQPRFLSKGEMSRVDRAEGQCQAEVTFNSIAEPECRWRDSEELAKRPRPLDRPLSQTYTRDLCMARSGN